MSNYKPPYTITNKMLEYVSSISEKVGNLKGYSHLEVKPHLRRNNRIKSIHSSLKIEANSLSLSEVRDVINGRMARLWHTVLLYQWRDIFEYIPLESQIEKFQNEYYDAIAACHVNGNSDMFIEFMLEQIDNILDEVTEQFEQSALDMSEYVQRMLAVMEYDIPYTAVGIMEKLGLKSRETFRKNYMNPALELGIVQMTIPDKPNSRNQRYVRK